MSSNAVTEIMRFINYNKVIIPPVNICKIITVGLSMFTVQVCMEQNIITKSVTSNRIILIISFIDIPVVSKFFRTKYKDTAVSDFKVFNYRKSRKSLTKTNTVCKDTAVIFFKFIYNCKTGILLEVIKLIPDCALLKSSSFFW